MRRSLGGLLLLAAGACFALAASMFWMDRVAFSPSASTDNASAILGDENIREEVANLVASVDAPVIGVSATELADFIESIARIRAGAREMRVFVADAHARTIGERDEPVVITAAEQVQIVRNENVALQPDITLPVEEVGLISAINTGARWVGLGSLAAFVLLAAAGLLMRSEQGEFTFAFAVGAAATAAGLIIFGFLVPATVFPALSDDTWTGVFPRLARRMLPFTFVFALVSIGVGALAYFGTSGLRQRRARSTPLATSRYREPQRWTR
ncbi:MAG: hypothetical protein AAF945_08605 [Actinomycetota bacterium]